MENLERYLDEIVKPTIEDFKNNPTSVRHAFLACVATFHAVDYRAHPNPSADLRQKYRRRSRDFALVDKVAHAFKHVFTGKRSNPDLTAKEVISRPPALTGVAVTGLSLLGDSRGGVTINKNGGEDLLSVILRAEEFLRKQTTA